MRIFRRASGVITPGLPESSYMADIQMKASAICAACLEAESLIRPYQRMESAGRNASSLAASDSAGRSVYHSRR